MVLQIWWECKQEYFKGTFSVSFSSWVKSCGFIVSETIQPESWQEDTLYLIMTLSPVTNDPVYLGNVAQMQRKSVLYQSEQAKGFGFHKREIGRSEGKVE